MVKWKLQFPNPKFVPISTRNDWSRCMGTRFVSCCNPALSVGKWVILLECKLLRSWLSPSSFLRWVLIGFIIVRIRSWVVSLHLAPNDIYIDTHLKSNVVKLKYESIKFSNAYTCKWLCIKIGCAMTWTRLDSVPACNTSGCLEHHPR